MGDVISADRSADKHYEHSGFSSTITDSYASPSTNPRGITWTGSGVVRVSSDTGTGTETWSITAVNLNSDIGTGVDAILQSLSTRLEADTGNGQGMLIDLLKAIAKYSSDTGVGVDEVIDQFATVLQTETGSEVEAEAELLAMLGESDEGVGADMASILAELADSDLGAGVEWAELLGEFLSDDSGVGTETEAATLVLFVLLKLLQEKGLDIELSQEGVGND